jgi:hypothetical protein
MTDTQKRIHDITLTNLEREIEREADMQAALDPDHKEKGIRVFASKAELRRYNLNRRNW